LKIFLSSLLLRHTQMANTIKSHVRVEKKEKNQRDTNFLLLSRELPSKRWVKYVLKFSLSLSRSLGPNRSLWCSVGGQEPRGSKNIFLSASSSGTDKFILSKQARIVFRQTFGRLCLPRNEKLLATFLCSHPANPPTVCSSVTSLILVPSKLSADLCHGHST
jgi:hypothetical protein